MKQTVVRPSGIIRQPNELGEIPAGSLAIGNNIQIRRRGIIEPRSAFQDFTTVVSGSWLPVKVWPNSSRKISGDFGEENGIFTAVTSYPLIEGGGSTSTRLYLVGAYAHVRVLLSDGTDFIFEPGKTQFNEARKRYFFTHAIGPQVVDTTATVARPVGLPMLNISTYDSVSTSSSGFPYRGYQALLRYTDGDYVIRGPTSKTILFQRNPTTASAPQVYVQWGKYSQVKAGMVVELYRVPSQDEADLLGDRFHLSAEYTLTASDIVTGYAIITDTTADEALESGALLYTNSAQDGIDKSNFPAPPSVDVVTYKGATFYISKAVHQSLTVRIPHKWGQLTTTDERKYGIGVRQTTGNTTAGSNTITAIVAPQGLAIGQVIRNVGGGTIYGTIASVSGSTITYTGAPATSNVTGQQFTAADTLTIDESDGDSNTQVLNMSSAATFTQFDDYTVKPRVVSFANPALDITSKPGGGIDVFGEELIFTVPMPDGRGPFRITATNGGNYLPQLPESGLGKQSSEDPRTNRVHYSKIDQPEAVPLLNYIWVGKGTCYRLIATQDALLAFCSDGIFRIDGDGDDWSVRPFDPDTVLLIPDAVDTMDNTIYAWTNAGFVAIRDSEGVTNLSAPLIGEDIKNTWNQFQMVYQQALPYVWGAQVACDKHKREVWFNFYDIIGGEFYPELENWIWNVDTNTFVTHQIVSASALGYSPFSLSIVAGTRDEDHAFLKIYDRFNYGSTHVVFNSVVADDPGLLKQWIDVTLFFDDWSSSEPDLTYFWPEFSGVQYLEPYEVPNPYGEGPFEHYVAPLQNFVHRKDCKFGFMLYTDGLGQPYYQLKGLTYRYRLASEQLRGRIA